MEKLSHRTLLRSLHANGAVGMRKSIGAIRYRRYKSTTSPLGAAKPSKPPLKKSKKPLEYRPHKPPPPPQIEIDSKANPLRYRTIPIVFGSITLFGLSGYITYLYVTLTRPNANPTPTTPSAQQDVSTRYSSIAKSFDDSIDWTETMMGMSSLRKKLASQARGDVLEVSIGTGRNLDYYEWGFKGHRGVGKVDSRGDIKKGKIESFTAVDKSPEMLKIAHQKFVKMFPGVNSARWITANAAQPGAIPRPPRTSDGKYDTIVQTMGLCSVSDPVALLRNLGECVKEDEGRILLLEHGRGKWDWLNGALDKFAEAHAREFGCWWNRDLESIVRESGLEVVEVKWPKWWHGGTTWWIELRKPKVGKEDVVAVKTDDKKPVVEKGWWN